MSVEQLNKVLEQHHTILTNLSQQIQRLTSKDEQHKSQRLDVRSNVPWSLPLEVEKEDIRENFDFFKQNRQNHCAATGMDDWPETEEKKKIGILVAAIGINAMRRYYNFQFTETDKTNTENVLRIIESKLFMVNKNLIYDRYLFNTSCQQTDESMEDFIIRLKKIVKKCEYQDFEDNPDSTKRSQDYPEYIQDILGYLWAVLLCY